MQFVDVFWKDSFSSDDFFSDKELLAKNSSNTKQNLSSDDEIYWTIKHTREKLVIDENTDTRQNSDNETKHVIIVL